MTCRTDKPVRLTVIVALLMLFALGAVTSSADAAPGAGWEVMSNTRPSNLPPGEKGLVEIAVFNIGAATPSGKLTVTDTLPPGLTAITTGTLEQGLGQEEGQRTGLGHGILTPESGEDAWECGGTHVVTCTGEPSSPRFPDSRGGGGAGNPFYIGILVTVDASAHGTSPNVVTVAGGGASTPARTSQPTTISSVPAGFGFTDWDVWFSNEDGTIDTQAGSHPYSATFAFNLATARLQGQAASEKTETEAEFIARGGAESDIERAVGGDVNSIEAELPPGLIADPRAVPQCTRQELNTESCPLASQIGVTSVFSGGSDLAFEVYNMVPPAGAPAEFGFDFSSYNTFLDSGVRSGSDYGITTHVNNVPQREVEGSIVTLWGYPADSSHDDWRGNANPGGCEGRDPNVSGRASCEPRSTTVATPKPFLTLPTTCAGPQLFRIHADTWQHADRTSEYTVLSHDNQDRPTGFTGCEHLNFNPDVTLAPDTSDADTPAGLGVEVKPSVGGLQELGGLSTSDLQNTRVVLPAGVAINPGQAAGLQACQSYQDGLTSEAEKAEGKEDDGPPSCPSASKVGTVTINTPLLAQPLEGNVYVLQSNPPNLQLLVAVAAEGVNVKLVGDVHLDEATGQLTTTFEGTPELPFTDFKLSFSGGAQAALTTPPACGTYTADADFTPWSSPFIADFQAESSFLIGAGPGGGACPSTPRPFAPTLTAGATTDQAGGYTNFSLLLQNGDGQQRISRLQFKAPAGLSGMISKVPLCGEPQAAQGTCPAASQIGHTVVAAGPGPYPLVVPQPGQPPAAIYLTGPYEGAPFGLSIVVPLVVGPFTLQTQVVRGKIEVDPHTAQITIATDPLPQIIDGIPTDLRSIDAVIDRPGFMFNPTNCNPQAFSGTAFSAEGAAAAISSHFQMGSCRSLTFKPDFQVSTPGKTSRANGAGLVAKIVYPTTPLGANQASSQSNIASVKVDLPRQLPSRLTTLQKACTSAQFDANPAGCPSASLVGHAKVITPILPVALTGPAYFVSRGGEAFPQLIVVLQGYGVTVDLVGDTFISKAGITSSTFKATPDVPFSLFELSLPEGKYSALAANLPAKAKGSFCGQTLTMPTAFVGQNGAVIHQSTKITPSGCAKAKKKTTKKHKSKTAKRGAGKK
jgi:uncharacterized repeat protein (TIGR01451 family)